MTNATMTEADFVRAVQAGDKSALNAIVKKHTPMIRSLAARVFKRYNCASGLCSVDDLAQAGFMELIRCAKIFDPNFRKEGSTKSPVLMTYAFQFIVEEMQTTASKMLSQVHRPLSVAERWLMSNLTKTLKNRGGVLTGEIADAIAAHRGCDAESVWFVWEILSGKGPTPLNLDVEIDGATAVDTIADTASQDPLDLAIQSQEANYAKLVVSEFLKTLNEREQQIVQWRKLSDPPVSYRECGRRLGITVERVRQIWEWDLGPRMQEQLPLIAGRMNSRKNDE